MSIQKFIEIMNKPLSIESESLGTIIIERFIDQDFGYIQKANEEKKNS